MQKVLMRSATLLSLCSCLGIFQVVDMSSAEIRNARTSEDKTAVTDESKYKKSLILSNQLPRFGFNNMSANINFLSFLQYFGDDEMRNEGGYNLSSDFFELIVEDDPYYLDFYLFLSGSVSLKAAHPEKSVKLMNQGLASLSPGQPDNGYYIWRYKGSEELLFLGDSEAAKHSFKTAAKWAHETATEEGDLIASISEQTANFLEQNPDSKSAQIGAWSSILTTAIDDETRSRAIEGIEKLGGEVTITEDGGVTVRYAQTEQETGS